MLRWESTGSWLTEVNAQQSVGSVGYALDNVLNEITYGRYKTELIYKYAL